MWEFKKKKSCGQKFVVSVPFVYFLLKGALLSFCVELEAGCFLAFHCFINSLRDDRRLDGKWGVGVLGRQMAIKWPLQRGRGLCRWVARSTN